MKALRIGAVISFILLGAVIAQGQSSSSPCAPDSRTYGELHIAWINCNHASDEVVMIVNGSSSDIDLTGYRLASNGQGQNFSFPNGTTIKAYDVLRIHSGSRNLQDFSDPRDLHWLKADGTRREATIWNNEGDTGRLYGPNDSSVDSYNY